MKPLLRPVELHIPDGFLNGPISLIFWLLTIALIALAVYRTRGKVAEHQVPLMGVMAAFIFAAQMINFPVLGGTSGHLLGGTLAAITLGPWPAMLVMTAVIGVQALVFQDGGLSALGANIFNMGLLTVMVTYGLYRLAAGRSQNVRLGTAFVAAWLSVMASALVTSFQLWLSGASAVGVVFPAMLGVHALIGIGEGLITAAALGFIFRTRPDLVEGEKTGQRSTGWALTGLAIALVVVLLSPFASGDPDGLERVAINLGFIDTALDPTYEILPDYTIPFLGESAISTILAGAIGGLLVAGLLYGLVRFLRRSSTT